MTVYYVATNGSNSANGSAATPFRTIQHALDRGLNAGDEIVVRAGTYAESLRINDGGSAAGNVVLRAEVPGTVKLAPPSNTWNGISVNANYVTVKGFEIVNAQGDGIEANNVHHIEIRNNVVHGSGESGIQFNWSEFIIVDGNTTYENANDGWFSGISVYQNRNITGDKTTPGFRTVITNNVSYDNVTKTGQHTDGNGIIIDDFQSTQTGGFPNYTYPTLVENNLVYQNGGKGIQVCWSDYVTVRGNTAWHNNQDLLNTGTWRGELSNAQASNNTWVNNIAVADPKIQSNNTAIDNTSYGGYRNQNIVWANNVTFNGVAGQASVRTDGNNAMPTAANGNLLGVNPLFVGPPNDFRLSANSPAIDAGTSAYGVSTLDLDGTARVEGVVDIGAYESGTKTGTQPNRAPVAGDDTGFSTTTGTAITISTSTLRANDTDPDGDSLTVTGVGSAQNGTVTLSGGSAIFTPTAGYTGTATFDYTISDGRGGTDTGRVFIEVKAATAPPPPPPPADDTDTFSLWTDQTRPATPVEADFAAVTLGLKFTADVDAELQALRIYVSAENAGSQTIDLWSPNGTKLATATANVSGTGWQTVEFKAPIALKAGQTYIASYYAPEGQYAVTEGFFKTTVDAGPIRYGQNAGVYSYGSGGSTLPDETYNGSNYWVDVVLEIPSAPDLELVGATTIGEAGVVVKNQAHPTIWHSVTFKTALDDPSVVMGGFTGNDPAPYTVQVRNITDTGFQYRIEEWDYLDGIHGTERISWLAIEKGTHVLSDGRVISAGQTQVGGAYVNVAFDSGAFDSAPVVLGQSSGGLNTMTVTDRVADITASRFRATLIQQEKKVGTIVADEFSWIAVEQGGSATAGNLAGKTAVSVTDRPLVVDFAGQFASDSFAFVTDIQTRKDRDPATLQTVAINRDTVTLRVLEEQSYDLETTHAKEQAGYVGFNIGLIQGTAGPDLLPI